MKRSLFFVLFVASLTVNPTSAQASDEGYEEVGYDQLVNEISRSHRRATPEKPDAFDQVKIHAGFGQINSFSTFNVNGKSATRYENGLQISMGVDLFSDKWLGEAAFRNFGMTTSGSETHYLKELDLKLAYHDALNGPWQYRLQGGLSHRYLEFKDSAKNFETKETTPGILAGAGLILQMNKVLSLGFDVTGRSSVLGQSTDRSSLDFGAELKVSL